MKNKTIIIFNNCKFVLSNENPNCQTNYNQQNQRKDPNKIKNPLSNSTKSPHRHSQTQLIQMIFPLQVDSLRILHLQAIQKLLSCLLHQVAPNQVWCLRSIHSLVIILFIITHHCDYLHLPCFVCAPSLSHKVSQLVQSLC